ncbi:hypothetical protein LOS22_15410, partial [Enterococcus faecium]|nr:hypothetical protein [Enterococcus faecium]
METKICKTCGKELAITAFNLDRGRRRASCGAVPIRRKTKVKYRNDIKLIELVCSRKVSYLTGRNELKYPTTEQRMFTVLRIS